MAINPQLKLLCAALAQQGDTGTRQELGEQRAREILAGSPASRHEQQTLLMSTAARRQLYFIANVIRAEQLVHWRQLGVQTCIELQAAAQAYPEHQPICIDSNPNFTVTLFPPLESDDSWIVHLKMTTALLIEVKGIRLTDSSGLVWLSGRPDADGEISQPWRHDSDPLSILQSTQLNIEPY